MREHKYRFWDKKEKKMGEPFTLRECIESEYCPLTKSIIYLEYTGLKDKNGVEICQGDIVEVGWSVRWYGTNIAEVKFGEKQVFDGCCGHSLMHGWYLDTGKKIESLEEYDGGFLAEHLRPDQTYGVIGNIYENPELLKENK